MLRCSMTPGGTEGERRTGSGVGMVSVHPTVRLRWSIAERVVLSTCGSSASFARCRRRSSQIKSVWPNWLARSLARSRPERLSSLRSSRGARHVTRHARSHATCSSRNRMWRHSFVPRCARRSATDVVASATNYVVSGLLLLLMTSLSLT